MARGLAGVLAIGGLLSAAMAPAAVAASPTFAPAVPYGAALAKGVDTGDLNGDGKLDVVAVGSGTTIRLGDGAGGLGPATHISTLGGQKALLDDLNGDGHLDLALARGGSVAVAVALGTGTGTFGPEAGYGPASFDTRWIAGGDLDGDADVDLAFNAPGNSASVILGTGTGAFGPATSYATGSLPRGVALGHLDGDGHLDMATANGNSHTVSVMRGTGTGTFSAATSHAVGLAPVGVAIGDLDHDGIGDLAVGNSASNTVSILLGTGIGFVAAAAVPVGGQAPTMVAIEDFNVDGHPDLAFNNGSGTVGVAEGTGTGAFRAAVTYPAGTSPQDVTAGDLNADGRPDLIVANEGTQNVTVHLNTTDVRAPETMITSGPAGLTNDPNPVFTFGADEPATFECSLDQGTPAYVACASGDTFPVPADGSYTFRVRATDAVGNVDATPATRELTVDTTAPATTITSGPSGLTTDPNPVFTFGADEPATFECSLDQGSPSYAPCVSGDTFAVAMDGSYTFRVRATDIAGNTDATSATRELTLDTAPAPVFAFTGFFQPVDNLPTLNLTSPGQGVAVKFSLGGDHGLDVLAAGYPRSQQVTCDSTAEVDGIESTAAAGGAGLSYDAGADLYTYVWKTQRSWAGTCRQLVVRFSDESSHRAAFKFRR